MYSTVLYSVLLLQMAIEICTAAQNATKKNAISILFFKDVVQGPPTAGTPVSSVEQVTSDSKPRLVRSKVIHQVLDCSVPCKMQTSN